MYLPSAFRHQDRAGILAALRAAGFGHLVTVPAHENRPSAETTGEAEPDATALPFLVDDELTVVRAHLARANRHWRGLDGRRGLLIVPVADTYISPRWYPSKAEHGRVVPTWNYELIHLRGRLRVDDTPEGKLALVRDLTDHHEAAIDGTDRPWSVDDAPPGFVDAQLRAIVAVHLDIDGIEAKRKLSQNRPEPDRRGVIDALSASPRVRDRQVGARMLDDQDDQNGR